MIRYGVNPIGWINDDDLSLGDHIPLAQCLREAAEIGFEGIEMGRKMPADPRALREVLAPHGLELVSAWCSLELLSRGVEAEKAALDTRLRLLREMGCEVCIVCETSGSVHGRRNAPLSTRADPLRAGVAGLRRGAQSRQGSRSRTVSRCASTARRGSWRSTHCGPSQHLNNVNWELTSD